MATTKKETGLKADVSKGVTQYTKLLRTMFEVEQKKDKILIKTPYTTMDGTKITITLIKNTFYELSYKLGPKGYDKHKLDKVCHACNLYHTIDNGQKVLNIKSDINSLPVFLHKLLQGVFILEY